MAILSKFLVGASAASVLGQTSNKISTTTLGKVVTGGRSLQDLSTFCAQIKMTLDMMPADQHEATITALVDANPLMTRAQYDATCVGGTAAAAAPTVPSVDDQICATIKIAVDGSPANLQAQVLTATLQGLAMTQADYDAKCGAKDTTAAGGADSGAGAAAANAGAADSNAGAADSNAGAADSNAGAADSNAGAADSNAGAADSNAGAVPSQPSPVIAQVSVDDQVCSTIKIAVDGSPASMQAQVLTLTLQSLAMTQAEYDAKCGQAAAPASASKTSTADAQASQPSAAPAASSVSTFICDTIKTSMASVPAGMESQALAGALLGAQITQADYDSQCASRRVTAQIVTEMTFDTLPTGAALMNSPVKGAIAEGLASGLSVAVSAITVSSLSVSAARMLTDAGKKALLKRKLSVNAKVDAAFTVETTDAAAATKVKTALVSPATKTSITTTAANKVASAPASEWTAAGVSKPTGLTVTTMPTMESISEESGNAQTSGATSVKTQGAVMVSFVTFAAVLLL